MPTNKVLFSDIIKFLIATSILLLGFLRKGEKVGETQENIFFQDYLSKTYSEEPVIEEETKETNNWENIVEETHKSAPPITDKCSQQDPLCQKIETQEEENIIPYKNKVHASTYFINENQVINKKIVDTIKKITIKDDDSQKRWYATRDTIVLNIWPVNDLKEFQNLSIHELWHIFDLWVIQWRSKNKSQLFTEFNRAVFSVDDPSILFYKISRESEKVRKKTATKKDFCSGYGMTNPFEDFAECFNLYINNQSFFKFIASKNRNLAQKYNFIATLLQGQYIEKNIKAISLVKEDTNRRPWDTTKL